MKEEIHSWTIFFEVYIPKLLLLSACKDYVIYIYVHYAYSNCC